MEDTMGPLRRHRNHNKICLWNPEIWIHSVWFVNHRLLLHKIIMFESWIQNGFQTSDQNFKNCNQGDAHKRDKASTVHTHVARWMYRHTYKYICRMEQGGIVLCVWVVPRRHILISKLKYRAFLRQVYLDRAYVTQITMCVILTPDADVEGCRPFLYLWWWPSLFWQ